MLWARGPGPKWIHISHHMHPNAFAARTCCELLSNPMSTSIIATVVVSLTTKQEQTYVQAATLWKLKHADSQKYSCSFVSGVVGVGGLRVCGVWGCLWAPLLLEQRMVLELVSFIDQLQVTMARQISRVVLMS